MNRWAKTFSRHHSTLALAAAILLAVPVAARSAQSQTARPVGQRILELNEDPAKQSFLGVNIWEVNAEFAKKKHLSEETGILITSVVTGSTADKAGIQKGDVVVEYNGAKVIGEKQFVRLVRETPVGRRVVMKVVRDGKALEVTATMGSKKQLLTLEGGVPRFVDMPDAVQKGLMVPDVPHVSTTWRNTKLGIVGESLDGQLADYFGVKEGVLVRSVSDDTPAARAGLRAGDVIVKAGMMSVATPRQLTDAFREAGSGTTSLTVMRRNHEITVKVIIDEESGGGFILRKMLYGDLHSL
jgi:serine protease Do